MNTILSIVGVVELRRLARKPVYQKNILNSNILYST